MGCGASHQQQNQQQNNGGGKKPPVVGAGDDPSPSAWQAAPRPNYTVNTERFFGYSEIPDVTQGTFPMFGLVPKSIKTPIDFLDFFGQGRVVDGSSTRGMPTAYNLNTQYKLVTAGANANSKIPNRIPVASATAPNASSYVIAGMVAKLMVDITNVPTLDANVVVEIVRLVDPSAGEVATFGYQESDLVNLYNALPAGYVFNQCSSAQTYEAITTRPQYTFSSQQKAINDMINKVTAANHDYAAAAGQLVAMFTRFNDYNQLSAFVAALLNYDVGQYVFPVMVRAAKSIQSQGGQWLPFVTNNVTNPNLSALIVAAVGGTNVKLSIQNNSVNATVYMNGKGNGYSDNSYQLTTDPDNGSRSDAVFKWVPAQGTNGVTFTCNIAGTTYWFVGPGFMWGSGPTYYSLASSSDAGNATDCEVWLAVPENASTSALTFSFACPNNEVECLNGMGDEWSGGPSWFVTSELTSNRGGNFSWSVTATS